MIIISLLGSLSVSAAEVCIIRYVSGGVTSLSCNGGDYQMAQVQLSGVLQQKLEQKFSIHSTKSVGNELIYTLIKK